jgi:hypothetical protein
MRIRKTIDNDIPGTDFCIGFDSAVNTAYCPPFLSLLESGGDSGFSHPYSAP